MIPTCSPYFHLTQRKSSDKNILETKKTPVTSEMLQSEVMGSFNLWDYLTLHESEDPLLNVYTCGWQEDGRLGYPADLDEFGYGSHIQFNPRPIPELRPVQRSKEEKKKAAFGANQQPSPKPSPAKAGTVAATTAKPTKPTTAVKDGVERGAGAAAVTMAVAKVGGSVSGALMLPLGDTDNPPEPPKPIQYVCMQASAGSRHTLFLMVDCRVRPHKDIKVSKKVFLTGLCQQGLCEEPGHMRPVEVMLPLDEEADQVLAGYGTSFVITKLGNIFSWGNGRYGVLGHGDEVSIAVSPGLPKQIYGLNRCTVRKISAGMFHACALVYSAVGGHSQLYSWGRNNKGQLGLELSEDAVVLVPTKMTFENRMCPTDVSCGCEHTVALVDVQALEDGLQAGDLRTVIYAWGDDSMGQLGSGDRKFRNRPQENKWMSKFLKKWQLRPVTVAAGGYHNLLLTAGARNVISWGANDYGQLGHGGLWNDAKPRIINGLKDVVFISAGLRHSCAVRRGVQVDFMTWGYNGYGELSQGDVRIRLQPTRVSAFLKGHILSASCGDRHTVIVTSPKPLRAKDDPVMKPFYSIMQTDGTAAIRTYLQKLLLKQGIDPVLLDHPDYVVAEQPGVHDKPMMNEFFERGLRYCMDTQCDPADWRRKAYEVCFEVALGEGGRKFKSVCLACARLCVAKFAMRPYLRKRVPGNNRCDCKGTSYCMCSWSRVRDRFDAMSGPDGCILPRQVKRLIQMLRHPVPIDREDVNECLGKLANGDEESLDIRIKPIDFEKWYRKYFDEYDDAVKPDKLEPVVEDPKAKKAEEVGEKKKKDQKKKKKTNFEPKPLP